MAWDSGVSYLGWRSSVVRTRALHSSLYGIDLWGIFPPQTVAGATTA